MIEYEQLRQKLIDTKSELSELSEALDIDSIRSQVAELEEQTSSADFWDSAEDTQKILQKLRSLNDTVDTFNRIVNSYDDILTMIEIAIEDGDNSLLEEIENEANEFYKNLSTLRLTTLLTGEYDENNAIMSFHPGAGGTEAQDWAQMLYRMYCRWAERHGFKIKLLDYLDGEEAGLKSATILIEGINAYGYLKAESGVHRLVRVSPFDSSGRRHTSFAAIEVIPEIGEDVDMQISSEDLRIDTYRAGGAGGQHVNMTDSAVRITHLPTGVVVSCQNERSQHQNREVAMKALISKLAEIKERENLDRIEDIKGEQKEIAWGAQIRSYVFMPYTLVKDHRTGYEIGNINAVMDGEIDGFINSYLKHHSLKK